MLVVSRKLYETIHIHPDITITVARIDRGAVRIGIDAPREISVQRGELREAYWTDARDEEQS